MRITHVTDMVEFWEIPSLSVFKWADKLFIKLPELECTVRECISGTGRTAESHKNFNAIFIAEKEHFVNYNDYYEFKRDTKVIPVESELIISD